LREAFHPINLPAGACGRALAGNVQKISLPFVLPTGAAFRSAATVSSHTR
jgi:hypothetical protein